MIYLSIIIPVFNNEKYIAKAIENYLSLASNETELLILDGGSTDNTVEIIQEYAENNNDIIWVSAKDKGQSDAMNKGIKLASGNYISFLNVDDYYSSNTFSEVLRILKANTKIDFLVGDCNVWDQDGELIYVNRPSKLKIWHILSGYHFPVNPTSYFYKKELHDKVGLYPEENHYNMDLEMLIRFRSIVSFNYYPITWGNFRMLPEAKTFVDQESNKLQTRKEELLKRYIGKQNMYIRFRVYLYIKRRKYLPKLQLLYKRLRDKIKYELKKRIN